ncbi:unnamed protein product [Arctia plantaginis]|uniref:TRAF-type domain-containing protein n=1 Tax=Arctia plantaginis TaxID=874455 RepID=A0A8S1ALM7_ARCPL|nr:unnamed protein product [Arctia plantaginis]
MEDTETKPCPNCKREIPCVNFTIHSVHCARNIRMCPVCKEPVPHNELQEHHDKLHKLLPCKKCGESVCGTDLEDHIRDSCAHTIKSCRFCELEVPRRDLPAHENYCGVRTEQCPECSEWVMIKYRQLHIDSNHGFIRLDDDPTPVSKKDPPITTTSKPLITKFTNIPSTSNGHLQTTTKLESRTNGYVKNVNQGPNTELRYFDKPGTSSILDAGSTNGWRTSNPINGPKPPVKRTNDQPQINTNVAAENKVDKNLGISRGAVKKRPAPKPPTEPSTLEPLRDLPYYSALQRKQHEEKARQEQTAYNLSVGLPPVLSPAAKLDKLRKMDALQNPEPQVNFKDKLQGRVWKTPDNEASGSGYVLGSNENERTRQEFKNLKPMTPQEFMQRFSELQLRNDGELNRRKSADRFSEIKSSLRELRRGLNEVTAPYNSALNNNGERANPPPPQDDDRLPCEFCDTLIPAADLVQHQTGCRPDLAQFRPRTVSPVAQVQSASRSAPRSQVARQDSYEDPVIPCEFCLESLPVYLISEHQERCGREANLLYAD